MAVSRANAVTGEQLELTIIFREDGTGNLFDPYSIDKVEILQPDGQTIIETILSGSITRLGVGEYKILTQAVDSAGIIQDKWYYKLQDGGAVKTAIETTNIAPAPILPAPVESQDALPRHSAVVLRPFLLTIEFRDDRNGEFFDPYEVRQVEILEEDGTTLIQTITSINRIGVGKYRVQADSISTPKTVLDKWYFTVNNGDAEQIAIQDTQVYSQAILGDEETEETFPELLYGDVGPTDAEVVLINSIEKIGVTFRDENKNPINPAKLSLDVTCVNGNEILSDTYLPLTSRDPNPPRIINSSAGRFEFPFGLDNGSTDPLKKNKTDQRRDVLFTWRASSIAGVKASATIDPGVNPNSTLIWTAVVEGTPGEFITVEYIDPAAPNIPLSISRNGATIVVTLATNSLGNIISTAVDVLNVAVADEDVSAIVTPSIPTGQTGNGVVGSVSTTTLSGGVDASEELVVTQNVRIISYRIQSLLQKLRLQIDKALKLVKNDPDCPVFLGYTDGQLVTYVEQGLQIINAYQPSGTFSLDTYPYSLYEFTLIESALMAGVMSQQLFAVDTDVPNWSDQGNSFVIQHQPQLVQYLNWLSQRLDKIIPQLKLNFVSSGSLHIEAGPNFRLATLITASPSGSLFRNVFFRA